MLSKSERRYVAEVEMKKRDLTPPLAHISADVEAACRNQSALVIVTSLSELDVVDRSSTERSHNSFIERQSVPEKSR